MTSPLFAVSRVSRDTMLVSCVLGLLLVVFLVFAARDAAEVRARNHIVQQLNNLSSNYRVTLNGRSAEDHGMLVVILKRVQWRMPHHSSATDPIEVEIKDAERVLQLTIAQDSERADEYWVFQPRRSIFGNRYGQEAGRIIDSRLRTYLAEQRLR